MKNIIITGANGNLGSAVTEKFLSKEYNVIATVENQEAIHSLHVHPNLHVHAVNLTNEKETAAFIAEAISTYKTIDGALLLVGGFAMGGIDSAAGDDLKKQYSLNFETAYFVARPLFTHMMKKGYGRLVFVGARPALDASAGKNLVAYGLSKSLLFKLAEFLNQAAKGKNVTATVIVPSTIDTPQNRQGMPKANPDDWVKPNQIADIMEIICSETGLPLRESVIKIYGNS